MKDKPYVISRMVTLSKIFGVGKLHSLGYIPVGTTKNISFHKVVPGILVCVPCPRSTFAHATLICTFLTN